MKKERKRNRFRSETEYLSARKS